MGGAIMSGVQGVCIPFEGIQMSPHNQEDDEPKSPRNRTEECLS